MHKAFRGTPDSHAPLRSSCATPFARVRGRSGLGAPNPIVQKCECPKLVRPCGRNRPSFTSAPETTTIQSDQSHESDLREQGVRHSPPLALVQLQSPEEHACTWPVSATA